MGCHSFPFIPEEWIPPAIKDMMREWSTSIDEKFYPTDCLSRSERDQLTQRLCQEGSVLLVAPDTTNPPAPCQIFPSVRNADGSVTCSFRASDGSGIDTVVIAGLGATALGTAAFARQVANYRNKTVLGIVSGNGWIDVTGEGLGGWFWLRTANFLSSFGSGMNHVWPTLGMIAAQLPAVVNPVLKRSIRNMEWMDDVSMIGISEREVLSQVMELCPDIRLLVGHSKGNFILGDYLHKNHERRDTVRTVTLGAPVIFPQGYTNHYQVVGSQDWRGWLNRTAPCSQFHIEPGATHRVGNREADALDVASILKKADV